MMPAEVATAASAAPAAIERFQVPVGISGGAADPVTLVRARILFTCAPAPGAAAATAASEPLPASVGAPLKTGGAGGQGPRMPAPGSKATPAKTLSASSLLLLWVVRAKQPPRLAAVAVAASAPTDNYLACVLSLSCCLLLFFVPTVRNQWIHYVALERYEGD